MATVLSLDGGGWSIRSGDDKHVVEGAVPGYALQALVEAGKEEDPLKGCVCHFLWASFSPDPAFRQTST